MVPGSRTAVLGPDKVVYLLENARIATPHISVSVLRTPLYSRRLQHDDGVRALVTVNFCSSARYSSAFVISVYTCTHSYGICRCAVVIEYSLGNVAK